MKEDKVVKLLEEIRDLQAQQVASYAEYLQKTEEKYDSYLKKSKVSYDNHIKKIRNLFIGFVAIVIFMLFIAPILVSVFF